MGMKTGDTVRLKSGGPIMTVTAVYESGVIECRWYSGVCATYEQSGFPEQALELAEVVVESTGNICRECGGTE